MENQSRYAAIVAIFRALGVEPNIADHDSRLQMQKAIYLAQRAGVDLGYRFRWYLRGPYSSSLADDYYEAARHEDFAKWHASGELDARLTALRRVLDMQPNSAPTRTEWLEALASVDFLKKVRKIDAGELKETFAREKPRLANLFDDATSSLAEADLL